MAGKKKQSDTLPADGTDIYAVHLDNGDIVSVEASSPEEAIKTATEAKDEQAA